MAYNWKNFDLDQWNGFTESDWGEFLIEPGEVILGGTISGISDWNGTLGSLMALNGGINASGIFGGSLDVVGFALGGNLISSGTFSGTLILSSKLAGEISGVGAWSGIPTVALHTEMPLYIRGMNPFYDSIPLYIAGYNDQTFYGSIPLYLYNAAFYGNLSLIIEGSGRNWGYIPFSEGIPLYLGGF